jgi:DNA-binding CsgD family transcriptional regulator
VTREKILFIELTEALGSSLDLRAVVEQAYPQLLRLVPAECGALGFSASGRPEDYAWLVAEMPSGYFAAYPELAQHDFVREAVMQRPNLVLRDSEMLPRACLEQNAMYRRARELQIPLEQVMAVMLHAGEGWQSGLALYRERRRPFSDRERALLQRLTPVLANTVRNCHMFGEMARRASGLERWLDAQGGALVVITPPETEVARTAKATTLLDTWWSSVERRPGRLPDLLLEVLAAAVASSAVAGSVPPTVTRRDGTRSLEITFTPLPEAMGPRLWALSLCERTSVPSVPSAWRKLLTPAEQAVVMRVCRGWDNHLIATDLGCAEATVKVHLKHAFDKLGVPRRGALIVAANELLRGG